MDLTRLFHPASIAVVGANERPGGYAAQTLLNLQAVGFPGAVYGVNPNRTEVFGLPCVPTLADLPQAVDAVVVAIPAHGVPSVIDAAGERGCGGAVVFSAGFAEVAEGADLQHELVAAAGRHDLPVCGPNCNGIVVPGRRLALWGDALRPREAGPVALVAQSGNVAVNALAAQRGLRFHTVIASGNQAILSAADYLAFLAREDGLGAIALYLEDDGGPSLSDGLAACADAGIRVAVLKVGTSSAGARAAAAHSGAVAGDQRVFRSLVQEAGAAWAGDVHELLELAKALSVRGGAAGGGLAIMTCSGGDSAQGADEADRLGLDLPALSPATQERLRRLLPPAATVANPLDYTAMIWGDAEALSELVRVVGEDPAIGQVLMFYDQLPGVEGAPEESWRAVREGIISGAALAPVPTMVCSTLPELLDDEAAWRFAQAGIPAVAGLRAGLRCVAAMRQAPGDPRRLRAIAVAALRASELGRAHRTEWLAEHEAKALLRAGGLSIVDGRLVRDEDDALRALTELGPPVAVKLSAASVRHKSELGGVALGVRTPGELLGAYRRVAALAAQHHGDVLVERLAEPGVELLVAARADTIVPALVLGLGGVWTELLDDVAIVPLPASVDRVEQAMRGLRGSALLLGGRGAPGVDVGAAARLAHRTGELLLEASLRLVELNPVIVGVAGAVAVDATAARPFSPAESRGAGAGPQAGLDRPVDEAGPAVGQVRAGQ